MASASKKQSPKIYTKGGDGGETSLLNGKRVKKSDGRLHAYGTIDELNSTLGLVIAEAESKKLKVNLLQEIQSELFVVGSHLATTDLSLQLPTLSTTIVRDLEKEIDKMQKKLKPLKNFILPGGSKLSALTHLARATARRAERYVVEAAPESREVIVFINRLSDYLFVLARYFNFLAKTPDLIWKP